MEDLIDTERLKQYVDLADLAGRYVQLHRESGHEWSGPCPKCGGEDRFHVTANMFFCRQCYELRNGKPHDAIAFVQWLGKASDFRAACEWLGAKVDTGSETKRKPEPKPKAKGWQDADWQAEARRKIAETAARLNGPEGEPGRAYLTGRGFTAKTWEAWGLGYGVAWDSKLRRDRPAIVLPWQRDRVTAVKYRFIDQVPDGMRYTCKGGSELLVFGLQMASRHPSTLFLAEGELNAVSIWQALRGVWALNWDVMSFGAEGKAVSAVVQTVAGKYNQVIVWCDKPELAADAASKLPEAHGMRSPTWDGQKLDANELLKHGALGSFLMTCWSKFDALDAPKVSAQLTRLAE